MSRHEDSTRLYVGHLSSRTRSRDLEHIFSRYGRVRDVDMKRDYAFIEFSDPRDAEDASYKLDGKDVDGRRITVEFARGVPRGPGGSREYGSGAPAPGAGRCFNCGIEGHWARDCKAGDWKNKCYRCGERGHVERSCRNSPKKLRRERSYSRSPLRSYSPHRGRSRSRSVSPTRSYSRSRSPARRVRDDERRVRGEEGRSRSPHYRSSKSKRDISPPETRKRSPTPNNGSENEGYISNDDGASPKETSRSPIIGERGPDEKKKKVGYPNSGSDSPENKVLQPRGSDSPENKVLQPRGSDSPKLGGDDANEGDYARSSESP